MTKQSESTMKDNKNWETVLTRIYKNFSVVMCDSNKRAIQKHNQVEYTKASFSTFLLHMDAGGMCGILTGIRSNNLEVIDFDLKNSKIPELFMGKYEALVREEFGQKFIDAMYRQATLNNGVHWVYRVSKVDGSKKISMGENGEAIVESRGNGGYFIAAPSKGYVQFGSVKLEDCPVISVAERDKLWLLAKTLEEAESVEIPKVSIKKHDALTNEHRDSSGQVNYWEKFDEECDYLTLLEGDGWWIPQRGSKGNGKYLLVRPDKSEAAWSADLDLNGHGVPLLYVYSTSTALEAGKAYSPSSYLIYYRFSGDAVRAYDWLIDNGYAPERKVKEIREMDKAPTTLAEAATVFDKYAEYKIDDTTTFDRPVPILNINGVGVLYTGELLTISGESKSGKSALLSAAIAKVLNPDAQGFEIITTQKTDFPIIHLDTEQPIHRHFDNQKNHIMKRAGLSSYPKQLMSYNLRRMSVEDRKLMASEVIEGAKIQYGGVFMVIFDGIADFIQDTNDIKQSQQIVSWMLEISSEHNCGVVCVIHLNPSPEGGFLKQRGHLGSELQRKTDSLLVVKKDPMSGGGEQSTITAQYLRNGGITELGEHIIYYDKTTYMHQILRTGVDNSADNENSTHIVLARRIAGHTMKNAVRLLVNSGHYKTLPTAERAIKDLIKYGYATERDGKIMSEGNLNEGKLTPIAELTQPEEEEKRKAPF